ncbi:MAG: RDD family protein [Acidobacteria bacterium]|nr:RDD family protein [Acidobacteriota bacterium]
MKCPKCGFVSFPGLDQCKKCGYRFTQDENQEPGTQPLFSQPAEPRLADVLLKKPEGKEQVTDAPEIGSLDQFINRRKATLDLSQRGRTEAGPSKPASSLDWQKELSERMQEYRRRRARIGKAKEDDEGTLDLDFKSSVFSPDETEGTPNVIEFPPSDESNLEEDTSQGLHPISDTSVLERFADARDAGGIATSGARQIRIEPPSPAGPMEIELEPFPAFADAGSKDSTLEIAPMSKRFLAGAFDLLVLLAAASVFAAIFWRAGGRVSSRPLDLVIVALVGVILLMAYFGAFTVFAYGTPGLLWAGLEIRTFEGNPPKRIDCFWRSFGYLVSISALMLGFIWALVDGDGLTWHDRMSRTFLVLAQDGETLQAAESVSQ